MSGGSPLDDAFDPARFRADGHALIDALADELAGWARRDGAVLPWCDPDDAVRAWQLPDAPEGLAEVVPLLLRAARESHHLHHPRYIGHQVTAPLPQAALADLTSSLLNNGAAIYEMGPVAVAMERVLIRALADRLGLPAAADGVFTSGGSAGNLTALLAARQARAGFDVWARGVTGGPPLGILVSSQAHYSVARAASIMGLGGEALERVPVDAAFRMRTNELPAALLRARARGLTVFAVVASAASTATGAFDDLTAVADFAAANGLWLHVDGAHGASLALSARPARRALLGGIERADSVVWDAHKLMLVPALCTAVLYRNGADGRAAFAQDASYIFQGSAAAEPPWWDMGLRTLECTKLMLILKLYVAWRTLGPRVLGDYVDGRCDLATQFAARLRAAADFELGHDPDCDIVCFRFRPAGLPDGADLDALQIRIRLGLVRSGAFYIVQTTLPAGVFLRVTIVNVRTQLADLDALLEAIRAAG